MSTTTIKLDRRNLSATAQKKSFTALCKFVNAIENLTGGAQQHEIIFADMLDDCRKGKDIPLHSLDNCLYRIDEGLGSHFEHVEEFLPILGVSSQLMWSRPKKGSKSVGGIEWLSPSSVASFFMALRDFGFDVDPRPWVDAARPQLKKRENLTQDELTVYWRSPIERHEIAAIPSDYPAELIPGSFFMRRIGRNISWGIENGHGYLRVVKSSADVMSKFIYTSNSAKKIQPDDYKRQIVVSSGQSGDEKLVPIRKSSIF